MTFLAPWALALGVAGAVGAVLLHLVARHRPAAYLLPTARFIPHRQTMVSRAASRPRDLLLLLLRVLVMLCAGAAFARPVPGGASAPRARIVLLDRSSAVADPPGASRRARALMGEARSALLVTFDSVATLVPRDGRADSTLASASRGPGSLTAALVAARRAAGQLADEADSVELVLVSPVAAHELDAATLPVRALWPGAIRIERTAARRDTAVVPRLARAISLADALGPALAPVPVAADARAVWLRRAAAPTADDSARARAGAAVVVWDSVAAPLAAEGLAVGDDVIVAPLGRRALPVAGAVLARWADGVPAARETALGAGCIRTVGIAVPARGDLALRPGFQRVVRALVAPCTRPSPALADEASIARLAGGGGLAPARALAGGTRAPSLIVPWLLGAALACALLELVARRAGARAEGAA